MSRFLSTRQVAARLGIRPSVLGAAVWNGRLIPPVKSPDGSFLWTEDDIERASWAILHRPYTESNRVKRGTIVGQGASDE